MKRSAAFRPILRPVALAAASLVLSACGGGGGDSTPAPAPTPTPTTMSVSGYAVDGYVAGATINCLKSDALVASTTSDALGKFAFNLAAGQSCDTLESIGGTDIGITLNDTSDDLIRPARVMRATVPAGTSAADLSRVVVSPLTTLVEALVAAGSTPAAAESLVKTSLGIPAGTSLLTADPAADLALYRAANVVAQIVEQVASALAVAGGVSALADQQALADAAIGALAGSLSGASLADFAAAPATLTPTSPLVAVIERAAQAAQAEGIGGATLAAVQPATLALVAAPLVASTTSAIASAGSIQATVDQTNEAEDQDRVTTVVTALAPLLDNVAGDPATVLADVSAAVTAADAGATDEPVTISIGGETADATVAGGLANYALLAGDQVTFYTSGAQSVTTLPVFESAAGVTVPQAISRMGFVLGQSAVGTQLDAPIEAPLALQVTDATRNFQAIFDRVSLSKDGTGKVVASLPAGAKVSVYGKTVTTETTSPLVMTLAGDGLNIVRTTTGSGEISLDFDKLFDAIGGAAAPGSALSVLAANRVANGSFDVTVAIGTLRLARATSATDATPRLAGVHTVTLVKGTGSVSGYGMKGKVVVGP